MGTRTSSPRHSPSSRFQPINPAPTSTDTAANAVATERWPVDPRLPADEKLCSAPPDPFHSTVAGRVTVAAAHSSCSSSEPFLRAAAGIASPPPNPSSNMSSGCGRGADTRAAFLPSGVFSWRQARLTRSENAAAQSSPLSGCTRPTSSLRCSRISSGSAPGSTPKLRQGSSSHSRESSCCSTKNRHASSNAALGRPVATVAVAIEGA